MYLVTKSVFQPGMWYLIGPSDPHEEKGWDTKHPVPLGPNGECTSDACVVFPHISAWWTGWHQAQSDGSCHQWSGQTAHLHPHCRGKKSGVLSHDSFMNMFFLQLSSFNSSNRDMHIVISLPPLLSQLDDSWAEGPCLIHHQFHKIFNSLSSSGNSSGVSPHLPFSNIHGR